MLLFAIKVSSPKEYLPLSTRSRMRPLPMPKPNATDGNPRLHLHSCAQLDKPSLTILQCRCPRRLALRIMKLFYRVHWNGDEAGELLIGPLPV